MIKSWNDIDLSLFQELQEVKALKDTLTTTEFYIEIISFLKGVSPEDPLFDEMSSGDLFSEINESSWIFSSPGSRVFPVNDLHPKPLSDLTLGEFIDIESFWGDPEGNLNKICALIWRKVKENEWGVPEFEPYSYDLNQRSEEFLSAPVTKTYGIISIYSKWREEFFTNYSELFMQEEDKKELEEVEEEFQGNVSRIAEKRAEILEERQKKWSWEALLWNMSSEDMTKIIPLLQLPVLLVFNMLSMRHSLKED